MDLRRAEIGFAIRLDADLLADDLELAAAHIRQVLPRRNAGRLLIEVDRDPVTRGDFLAHLVRQLDAIFDAHSGDGDEGDDVRGAHARVFALVPAQIDEFRGLPHGFDDAAGHRFRIPGDRNDAAVVRGVHLRVEQRHAGESGQRGRDGVHHFLAPAFAEIGHAFDDLLHVRSSLLITMFPFLMVMAQ